MRDSMNNNTESVYKVMAHLDVFIPTSPEGLTNPVRHKKTGSVLFLSAWLINTLKIAGYDIAKLELEEEEFDRQGLQSGVSRNHVDLKNKLLGHSKVVNSKLLIDFRRMEGDEWSEGPNLEEHEEVELLDGLKNGDLAAVRALIMFNLTNVIEMSVRIPNKLLKKI